MCLKMRTKSIMKNYYGKKMDIEVDVKEEYDGKDIGSVF